jgi:hypothetical protein
VLDSACAAEAALDAPRAAMIAAPRCCTVFRNSPLSQASSPIASAAERPSMVAL